MFVDAVYYPLIRALRINPEATALNFRGEISTYGRFAQRIAPIMNELDALSTSTIALVMDKGFLNCAAVLACVLTGKKLVPIDPDWSDEQRRLVLDRVGNCTLLTNERMFYYFRMTYDDAICRIDNGLPIADEISDAARLFSFEKGSLSETTLSAEKVLEHWCFPYFTDDFKRYFHFNKTRL